LKESSWINLTAPVSNLLGKRSLDKREGDQEDLLKRILPVALQ
jgi:hypothetical protein